MYIPAAFQEDDIQTLHGLIRHHSFGTLVSQHDGHLMASHLPFVLCQEEGPFGVLLAHMARANPQWRSFGADQEVLAMFQGPHAYVSPSWYETHPSVPTWNYAAVHAYGTVQLVEDAPELYELLQRSVRTYEGPRERPWPFALPDTYLRGMMQGIVGFRLRITRLEGKYKLSQNRSAADQERVVGELSRQGDALSTGVAALMRRHLPLGQPD